MEKNWEWKKKNEAVLFDYSFNCCFVVLSQFNSFIIYTFKWIYVVYLAFKSQFQIKIMATEA